MSARFHNSSILHDMNTVGVHNCIQAMRNHQSRFSDTETAECFLNFLLRWASVMLTALLSSSAGRCWP